MLKNEFKMANGKPTLRVSIVCLARVIINFMSKQIIKFHFFFNHTYLRWFTNQKYSFIKIMNYSFFGFTIRMKLKESYFFWTNNPFYYHQDHDI